MQLIGREENIKQLLEYIAPKYTQHITIVQGIGGIGKTSLVLEAAYQCLEARQNQNGTNTSIPTFDAIIFTSAKETDLIPAGFIPRPIKEATLKDILKTIAKVLNRREISKTSIEEQQQLIYDALGEQKTLLIIDNLETVKGRDREEILGFINNLPTTAQAIVTTREIVNFVFPSVSLGSLSKEQSLQLIQQQVTVKNINLDREQSLQLYNRFGGVPLALIYLVGQLTGKYSLQKIIDPSIPLSQDIAKFCFEESVKPLRETPSHVLLMSLAIFRTKSRWKALAKVSGLAQDQFVMEEGLDKLKQLSLIEQKNEQYGMLPLTREYALVELAKNEQFNDNARKRWIRYYQEFTEKYGGEDWQDWIVKYDILESDLDNILNVLNWCAVNGRYEEVITIWKQIDNFIDLRGDWDNRYQWWSWIEQQSYNRQNWSIYIDALSAQSWILILKGFQGKNLFFKAEKKILGAWDYEVSEGSGTSALAEALSNLAIIHSVLLKIQSKYSDSFDKLNYAHNKISNSGIKGILCQRYLIRIFYYQAEILNCPENPERNLSEAKILLTEVISQATNINWSRMSNYAKNELANIQISEGDYDKAKNIIDMGLRQAKAFKEVTRIGHWLASSWRLALKKGDQEKAERLGKEALKYFDNGQGLIKDAEEIKEWFKEK
ncbi:MAG: ATP-binding protein [Cyanobacteria bacterium J06621_8]